MTEKYIPYNVDGRGYKIPESKASYFEKMYPSATIRMSVEDRTYNIPSSQRQAFVDKYPSASYLYEENENKPEVQSPLEDVEPEMTRREKRKARREEKANDDKVTLGETLKYSIGNIGTTIGKALYDSALADSSRGVYIDSKTGEATRLKDLDTLIAEDDYLVQISQNMRKKAEEFSKKADPTKGEKDYIDLLKEGKLGTMLQKSVGDALQSAPATIAGTSMLLTVPYVLGTAASSFVDQSVDNPDIPAWKRGVYALGTSVFEQFVERFENPFSKGAGKELTESAAKEILEEGVDKGVKKIADRIFSVLKRVGKAAKGEGIEEGVTGFGNDLIGQALDWIDGDKDYGFTAQWEQLKEENPDADMMDFAIGKAREYTNAAIGGALSGAHMSGPTTIVNEVASTVREKDANERIASAKRVGDNLDYGDMYDTDSDVTDAYAELEKSFVNENGEATLTPEFLNSLSADEALILSQRDELSTPQRVALANYAEKKAIQEGLERKLDDRVRNQINANHILIDDASYGDGTVIAGNVDGRNVYVIEAKYDKGKLTAPNGNRGPVIVLDANTGERFASSTDKITDVRSLNAESLKGDIEQMYTGADQQARETARNTMSPRAKIKAIQPFAGKKILVDLGNGATEVYVQQIDANGNVLIKGKKGDLGGQTFLNLSGTVFYDSIYRDNDGNPVVTEAGPEVEEQVDEAPEVEVAEGDDFRDYVGPIIINGVPVEVEVTQQDDASDTIVYTYVDENGVTRRGSSSISEFKNAIQTAQPVTEVTPETEVAEPPVEEAPVDETSAEETPVEETPAPQPIDWKALFEENPQAYLRELQNQYGDRAAEIIESEIVALQEELEDLEKNRGKDMNERMANLDKKGELKLNIGILNELLMKLQNNPAPAPVEETPVAETPVEEQPVEETPVEEAPVAEAPQETGETSGENEGESVPLETKPEVDDNGDKGETPQGDTTVQRHRGGDIPRTSDGEGEGGNKRAEKGQKQAGKDTKGKKPVEDKYHARKGNATGKLLVDTFGLDSVTIPDSRKDTLNTIYDFMMEMAKMLGISPKSIGNGGWLGVANLRANNRATAAHFYSWIGNRISQTVLKFKYARLTGIAHEWWHALDHALVFFNSGMGLQTATEMPSSFDGRKETLDAVKGIMDAIKASGHLDRIAKLGTSLAHLTYLRKPTEQAARAFDQYIIDKFAAAGIVIKGYDAYSDPAYPTAEEMQVIAPAFDKLFEVLKEKEGKTPGTSVLYQIGEQMEPNSDAKKFATEVVLGQLKGTGINVVRLSDEETGEYLKVIGVDPKTQFSIDTDKPIFLSNAAVAVTAIKQEKATPEQWLKMIEKNGGLKAGEDKWMGLSDWLKASTAKTLTKQEVMDFINENTIRIEEVNYAEIDYFAEDKKLIDAVRDEFLELRHKAEDAGEWVADAGYIAHQQMADKYGDDFLIAFEVYGGDLYVANREAASVITGVDIGEVRGINETRIGYTTEGLKNNKEIAIVVPTIESWNEEDEIHFGDAGEGRAVAWVRFGETEVTVQDATQQRLNEIYDRLDELEMKVSSSTGITMEEYEERARLREERDRLQENEPKTQKVLVIDEIQSKRHQEGREKGYRTSIEDVAKATEAFQSFNRAMKEKYGENVFPSKWSEEDQAEFDRLKDEHARVSKSYDKGIPDAPFDKNWHELAMKRMLRYAAENGYDAIAWTKGEQQAGRYSLTKYFNGIEREDNPDLGGRRFTLYGGNVETFNVDDNGVVTDSSINDAKGKPLSDVVGKELAVKIMSLEDGDIIEGEDIAVGGEGMKGFYDKMLPAYMNKYGKKWGVKVSDIELPNVEEAGRVMHSVPVTAEMKASVMEGQPMFYKTPNGIVYGWTDGKDIYLTEAGMNPNTPVHEYTHLWAKAMMLKNPKGWNSVKSLLKNTPVWNEVLNDVNYSDIRNDEDAVASEVLSRISGTKNAAKLEQMAQQMIDEAKGTARKLEARGLVQNIKDALNKFWGWVGKELFGIEKFDSIEEVTDRVLWDLMNQTDLGNLEEGDAEFNKNKASRYKTIPAGEYAIVAESLSNRYGHKNVFGCIGYTSNYFYLCDYFEGETKIRDIFEIDADNETRQYIENYARRGDRFTAESFIAGIDSAGSGISRKIRNTDGTQNEGASLGNGSLDSSELRKEAKPDGDNGQVSDGGWFSIKTGYDGSKFARIRFVDESEMNSLFDFTDDFDGILSRSGEITPEMDAEYLAAVEAGDMETAQRLADEAAEAAGYTKKVYHGTPNFGFTEFESHRGSGAIFATTARNAAANYGGDSKYASVRSINKGIKDATTTQDVLDNAKSRFDQNWREATNEEREAAIKNVESIAKKVLGKIQELNTDLSNLPFELQNALLWMESVVYDAAEGRENGNDGDSFSKMLKDGYEKFRENREIARQLVEEYYDELTPEQRRYWSYINGFEVGDTAIDAGYVMARAVSDSDLVTVDGRSFMRVNELNDITQQDKGVGTYRLYGDLGSNPLIIDAGHNSWFNLDYNGMTSTDSIAEWAKGNGYTSVVFKNIYDYGDLSDVMVFYDSSQLKSADPVTYDDNGNVIPLSERFNPENPDIRYRTINEGETDLEFVQSAVADFLSQYKSPVPMTAVDVNDRAAVEVAIGFEVDELSDESYQMLVDKVNNGGRSIYVADTKRIVIFADARNEISADVDESSFHEITHALVDKNPAILGLGEWLWNNADKGARKRVKDIVLSEGYPVEQQSNEMLSRYTGMMLALGKAGAVLDMLPAEQKKHWDYILKEIGYEPERDDESRRKRHSVDSSRRRSNRQMASATLPDNGDARNVKEARQNEAVGRLVGTDRSIAIENAVNEEAAKLGVKVTYKTREEMPKGHKNDKGYFNTKTGEIVVCTENASSISDAIQTILHEAVAHKGLRALMGDRFSEFINRVYESLDDATKAKVDSLAETKYNGNKAVAMEEYMASLAETMDFENKSVWDKIKEAFEDIINKILGRDDIKIGDNELRYILRASYNHMSNPRTMDTLEGWAKDKMMREEYGVNEAQPELMSRTGIDPTEASDETAKQTYDRVVTQQWQEFQRQFQDAMQPVRIAIDAIQQETGNIPIEDYENYLLIQNQSSSRSRVEIDTFARNYYSPIIEQVNHIIDLMLEARHYDKNDKKKRAEAYAELKQYLIAKHGLERNKYYQEHNTRGLNSGEKRSALKKAKDAYDAAVAAINVDTSLNDTERELELYKAKESYDIAVNEINTRQVPDIRDYSGLTSLFGFEPKKFKEAEQEAEMVVEEFENKFGRTVDGDGNVIQGEAIKALWDRVNAATSRTLRHSYESGLISRAQYDEIKGMFKFYIPLRGFDETTAEDVYSYARFEGNSFSPAVQKAGGRTSVADDPIAFIMNMAESEIAQGNKNRAKQALYNYLLNRTNKDAEGHETQNSLMQVESVWYEVKEEDGQTVHVIATPDRAAGETYEEFENRMLALEQEDKAYKSKKGKVDVGMRFQKPKNKGSHYIYLKVNGVEKAIYINGDPKAADAVNGTYAPMPNKAEKFAKDVNRFVSSMFTNYSLEFTVRNFLRDMVYSRINIDIKESDPEYRVKFRKNFWLNNPFKMVGMLKAYRKGEFDNADLNETQAAFVEFMNNGGQTGYTLINSVENHKKELQRAIERMQKGIVKGGIKDSSVFKFFLGGIELLNEASELTTRFAAFKTSRDLGRPIHKSVSDAKEISVNFNTKGAQDGNSVMGAIARYFGATKYFFNAAVQGVQNISAMRDKNRGKFDATVGSIIAFGAMWPMLNTAILALVTGDDEEEEYWKIPEYDRQNNFCVALGNGRYFKIALPIGFREMFGIGDMAASSLAGKTPRDPMRWGMDFANKVASIALPLNPLEGAVNGLSLVESGLSTILPDAMQVLIQNWTNKDWKGAPLQKEYTYNQNDPQWTKAFSGNPAWITGLSKWCYEHIVVDGKGWDWSPEKLDNTLSNALGGTYSLIKKSGRMISSAINAIQGEDEFSISSIPVVGVFTGKADEDGFITSTYWKMNDYYNERISDIKRIASGFGYTLDEVFARVDDGEARAGEHHPEMSKIYNRKNFDFMQEWYLGHNGEGDEENLGLDQIKTQIDRYTKAANKDEYDLDAKEMAAEYEMMLEAKRRDLVEDLLELE